MGLQSPVSACRKALLPRPGAHLLVACEFTLRSEYLAQANPAARLFRFRLAGQNNLAVATAIASVAFSWVWGARRGSDGALALYQACRCDVVPSSSSGHRLAAEEAAKQFEGSSLRSRNCIASWSGGCQNAAFLRAVQLTQGKLCSVTVNSVTATMLKLKKSKFQQMTSTSPDGEHFGTEPSEYRCKVLHQATELHCGRHVPVDVSWVRRLADMYRPALQDQPDVHMAIRYAHVAKSAPEPPETSVPGLPVHVSGDVLRDQAVTLGGRSVRRSCAVRSAGSFSDGHLRPHGLAERGATRGMPPASSMGCCTFAFSTRSPVDGQDESPGHLGGDGLT